LEFLTDELVAWGGEDQKVTVHSIKLKKNLFELKGFENRSPCSPSMIPLSSSLI